jgi:hypothetical protein
MSDATPPSGIVAAVQPQRVYEVVDPNATLDRDCPCRKCAYNLRGLSQGGRCPECGTPVGLSTAGDLLRFADPNWLTTLARGLSFILWGILVNIIVGVFGAVALRGQPGQAWISIVSGLMGLWGAWLLTEPDPSGLGEERYSKARKLVRITLLVGLAGRVLRATLVSFNLTNGPEVGLALLLGSVGTAFVAIIGEFAQLAYIQKLAWRIPDKDLAHRANFIRWPYTMSLAVFALAGAVSRLSSFYGARRSARAPVSATLGISGCLGVLALLGSVVFGLMALFLLIRVRRSLFEQARLATDVWSAAFKADRPLQ